jgi:hypothetical protein
MSNTPKFSGGLFDVIQTGLNTGLPLALGALKKQPKAPKPCTLQNVYTQGEVALCLGQIWDQWNQITAGASAADRKATAQAILTILNDKGKWKLPLETAEANTYFNNTKAAFEKEAAAVVETGSGNVTGSGTQATQPTGSQNAETVTLPVVGQIDQKILLYGAGAVIIALLLSRKK